MSQPRTLGRLFIGALLLATAAVLALSCRLLVWPLWQKYQAGQAIAKAMNNGDWEKDNADRLQALVELDGKERIEAACALVMLDDDKEALRLLIGLLRDNDGAVRIQAATYLGWLKEKAADAVPVLNGASEDDDEDARVAKISAVVNIVAALAAVDAQRK